jgi:hypothetical protein
MPSTTAFINSVLADARVASAKLGIPTSVILAQWINETGSGGSTAWNRSHNYAGVSYLDSPEAAVGASLGPDAPILTYPSRAAGLAGYISRWLEPVYAPTRQVWSQTSDPIAVAQSIEASPWAAGHYGGTGLEALIEQNNLTAYDDPSVKAALPASGDGSVQTTAYLPGTHIHIPGTGSGSSILPNPLSGLESSAGKVVLTGVFLTAGLVLIVAGFWRAAAPRIQAAGGQAAQVAPLAAAAV